MQLYFLITFSLFISMHIQVPLVINLYLRVLPFFYFFFSLTPFSIWEWIRCFGISYVPAQYTSISAAKLPWVTTSLSLSLSLSIYPSIYLTLFLYIYLSLSFSHSLALYLSNPILIYPILFFLFYETFTIRSSEADYFLNLTSR